MVFLVMDDVVDEAMAYRDVSVDDSASVGFFEIDFEVAYPDHAMGVFKGVFDFEVHACVYEDKVFEFVVILEVFHPVNIVFGNLAWVFHAEAFKGFRGSDFFPVALDLWLKEMEVLVGFPGLDAIVLVIAFETMKVIAFGLEIPEVVDDLFAPWASVDIITQEEQLVFLGDS